MFAGMDSQGPGVAEERNDFSPMAIYFGAPDGCLSAPPSLHFAPPSCYPCARSPALTRRAHRAGSPMASHRLLHHDEPLRWLRGRQFHEDQSGGGVTAQGLKRWTAVATCSALCLPRALCSDDSPCSDAPCVKWLGDDDPGAATMGAHHAGGQRSSREAGSDYRPAHASIKWCTPRLLSAGQLE